jgi:hypothetical protein
MRPLARSTVLLVAAALALGACSTGSRSGRRPAPDAVTGDVVPGEPADPRAPREEPLVVGGVERIPGTPSIRIVWEALAGEQRAFRNPHTKRASALGQTGLPVSLINASFVPTPDQAAEVREMRSKGAVARIADRDMLDLLKDIEKAGFFDYARPTGSVRPLFSSERARGRVTIERGGESVTLLSQYGLGLQESTKAIPPIYASVKNTVLLFKNRSDAIGVRGKVDAVDPDRARRGEPPATK